MSCLARLATRCHHTSSNISILWYHHPLKVAGSDLHGMLPLSSQQMGGHPIPQHGKHKTGIAPTSTSEHFSQVDRPDGHCRLFLAAQDDLNSGHFRDFGTRKWLGKGLLYKSSQAPPSLPLLLCVFGCTLGTVRETFISCYANEPCNCQNLGICPHTVL